MICKRCGCGEGAPQEEELQAISGATVGLASRTLFRPGDPPGRGAGAVEWGRPVAESGSPKPSHGTG